MLENKTDLNKNKYDRFFCAQNGILSMIAQGASVSEVMYVLVQALEDEHQGVLCSALVKNGNNQYLRYVSAPLEIVDDELDPSGSPGSAQGDRVVIEEALNTVDAERHLLVVCQERDLQKSEVCHHTVQSRDCTVLGLLSMCFGEVRDPTPQELEHLTVAAQLVGIAVERHLVDAELIRSREAALQASRMKGEFLANMSHEIRTPLTAMLGFAENLRSKRISEVERNFALRAILRNGDHLLTLINDILDVSKVEAGKLEICVTSVNVFELVEDVTNLVTGKATEKGLALVVDWNMPIPVRIQSDPMRLKQILVNLLGNAVKFTVEGSVTLSIAYDENENQVLFQVRDTGIGMTAADLGKVFQPFVQGDAASSNAFGGTGLGLFITKFLAEKLGGRVSCLSELGVGSEFCVSLDPGPAADLEMTDEPPFSVCDHEFQEDCEREFSFPDLSGKVLIVDDTPDNRVLLTWMLEQSGLEVSRAENGLEGVEKAKTSKFDLILMDMRMPLMDGCTATRELRNAGLVVPIVGMSAISSLKDPDSLIKAGCNAYIAKPFKRDELFKVVATLLRDEEEAEAELGPLTEIARQIEIKANAQEANSSPGRGPSSYEDILKRGRVFFRETLMEAENVFLVFQANEQDLATIRAVAHRLAGSAGLYGHGGLGELAMQLEKVIIEEETSLAPALVAELLELVQSVLAADQESSTGTIS